MKTALKLIALCPLLSASCVLAQGTAFTYQGRLNSGATPANGNYDFRFRVASDPLANNYVGSSVLTSGVPVANGLFIVTLDFGPGIFTGSNCWLEVGVRTNNGGSYTTLNPLQPLTPTPYAQFATTASNLSGTLPAAQLSGAVPSANLSGTYGGAVTFNNATGTFSGNGGGLTNVNAGTLGGLGVTQFWKTAGNSNTIAGTNLLGTLDNQPLELWINGARALRLEPAVNASSAPNIIGGAAVNFVAPGIDVGTIGGGKFNGIKSYFGTIGGGAYHSIGTNSASSTISGGYNNTISDNSFDIAIGGGSYNFIGGNSSYAKIGGGRFNSIGNNATSSTIGGGYNNSANTFATYATLSGGYNNTIQPNAAYSAIAGGYYNSAGGQYAAVSGGALNTNGGNYSAIGGGIGNAVQNGSVDAFIGGGYYNTIQGGTHESVIVGGATHTIVSNIYNGFIGGGWNNYVAAYYATIGGGMFNSAGGRSGVISGGDGNSVLGYAASIPGGYYNSAAGQYSFAAGNQANANHDGAFVWADSTGTAFSSTAANQFLIRASGGVGIGTSSPDRPLAIIAKGSSAEWLSLMDASGATRWHVNNNYGAGLNFAQTGVADARLFLGTNGNAGIGTTSPQAPLHVMTAGEGIRIQGQSGGVDNLAYLSFMNGAGTAIGYVGDGGGADNDIYLASYIGGIHIYTPAGAALTASSSGMVGIGNVAPQSRLHVTGGDAAQLMLQNSSDGRSWSLYDENFNGSGNLIFLPSSGTGAYISRASGNYFVNSDVRLKRDITTLHGVLERMLQLRPVSYRFRSAPARTPLTLGLIAQEVEPLFPEVVGERDGTKSVAYSELIPATIGAIQELNRKVDSENAALRAENSELKQRLEALEKIVLAQKSN